MAGFETSTHGRFWSDHRGDRSDIEQRAGINKDAVVRTVEELKQFHIAQVNNRKGVFTFTLLDPATGRTLPSLNATVKDGPLTEADVVALGEALGLHEVRAANADDPQSMGRKPARTSTGGSLEFVCPCHDPNDKVKGTRGKSRHISASYTKSGWVYQCMFPTCRLHGKRKTESVNDDWADSILMESQ
jgi:hypothetical protein